MIENWWLLFYPYVCKLDVWFSFGEDAWTPLPENEDVKIAKKIAEEHDVLA